MRLYIGPCGLGLGHITRCDAIAREFSSEGVDVLFSSYLDALDYLKRSGFTYFSAIPLSFRTREDGTIDPKMTMSQNGVTVGLWGFIRQLIGEVRQITAFKPDVVISDTRISTLIAAFILRKPRILILNQYSVQMPKDNRKHRLADRPILFAGKIIWRYISAMLELAWGVSDLIIVPDLEAPHTISRYNLAIPSGIRRKVRLVGPLAPPKSNHPNGKRPTGSVRPLVFACVSGPATDRKYLVNKLTEILREFPRDYEMILSCGDPNGSFGEKKIGNLTVHEWMTEQSYWKTFERADVIVSRAGHETIMKAVSEGKPLVLIPPPNHTEQANNAKRAEELGVAVVVEQSRLDTDELAEAISRSLKDNRENARRLSETLGAESGIRAVVEAVSQLVSFK
ncbi:MAG TPA: glycosyltransferase [Candidatus Bathyarchaeia archaeon]|nr:glycosyltransferase [Candidatus Bathyarchaeia archaeon]